MHWLIVMGGVVAFVGFCSAVVKIWNVARRINHFFDDWFGEEARPGIDRRPGVMERIATLESDTKVIKKELTVNSGQSVKDAVIRIDEAMRGGDENGTST